MPGIFKIVRNNRGMALLLTILIISFILVITLRFNSSMRASITNASNLQNTINLDFMARSVFNSARAVLSFDAEENVFDTLHEDWANLEMASQYFIYFFGSGQGGMSINDHSGRFQINSLLKKEGEDWIINQEQKTVLVNLLSSEEFDLAEDEAVNISEAIIDWLDEDDEPLGFGGAEASFYQGLENPYAPRNSPMEFVEELLLVNGITEELYFGVDGAVGLQDLLTPHGTDGKININTADPLLLGALSDQIDQDMVDGMLDFRDNEDNDLGDPNWYKSWVPSDVIIPPHLITTASRYFEVSIDVAMGPLRKKVEGMIVRGPGTQTDLVYWKAD